MDLTILDSYIQSLDEYELAKHFMDKIIALEEQATSDCMETEKYESKLDDIIREYKLYKKQSKTE